MEWNAVVDLVNRREPWYKNNGLVVLNLCLLLPLMTASINGFDSSVVNGLQLLPDWQIFFHRPQGTALGFVNAAQNLGSLVAMPIAPYASDNIGRKPTLLLGSVIIVGGTILQTLAQNLSHFIAARALIGFGLCFATNAAPLLITELAYPTQARTSNFIFSNWRAPLTALYNSSWYTGSIVAAWATFAAFKGNGGSSWSWRIPSIVQGIGSILQCFLIWFVPESPRWLISKGKDTEAMQILARFHANGGHVRDPLVVFEWTQIRHALQLEREISKTTTWFTLFSSPGNRKRLRIILAIGLFSQWSGNGLVSYYINLVLEAIGIQDTQTKAWINGVLQVWNLVVAVSASLLVDRLGRRTLFITSTAGMLVSFSMWTLTTALFQTHGNVAAAKGTMGILFAFYLFYDMAYTPMLVAYTLEILPFHIRAKGFAVMNLTVCAALAFNQFVNPWALESIGWKYYLVYCGWLGFELCFVLLYVIETKGRTLEETATIFDGEKDELELHEVGTVAATQSLHALRDEGIVVSPSTHHLTFQLRPLDKSDFPQKEQEDRPVSSILASSSADFTTGRAF
ncbi:general substrate transporter [Ramaria rubella]|nr:general substrate transporter [Ramaria rubella]